MHESIHALHLCISPDIPFGAHLYTPVCCEWEVSWDISWNIVEIEIASTAFDEVLKGPWSSATFVDKHTLSLSCIPVDKTVSLQES